MSSWMQAALLIASFLMGSIPFGLVFTLGSGVDLRKTGSGNIGATNVLRSVGRTAAVLTLLGDALKGTAAVAIARLLGGGPMVEALCGLCAIVGHDFSIFLSFKGGKGVATTLGVFLILGPWAGVCAIGVWLLTVLVFRYSSLGSIMGMAAMPVFVHLFGYGWEKLTISVIISLLTIILHKDNIRRLLSGTEKRVGQKVEGNA